MIKILKSELYKIRHTWIPWAHLIIPILYAIGFYGLAKTTGMKNFDNLSVIETYLVLIGTVLPVIVGAITSKVVDMEVNAGHFQVLLSTTESKYKAYSGKLIALFIGGIFSVALAILSFGLLFGHQKPVDLALQVILIFVGSLSIYMIHLMVAILLGGGASIGLGFAETMTAFIATTSLGDKIWYFIPCTWSSRLPVTYVIRNSFADCSFLYNEIKLWGFVGIPVTICAFVGSLIWFSKWDGKAFSE